MPGTGDTVVITTDRALDPSSSCGIWTAAAPDKKTLANLTATLAPTDDLTVAALTLRAVDEVCGPAGLSLGTFSVDGRYLTADGAAESVAFDDSTLGISSDGLTVTLVLGIPDEAGRLRAVIDPAAARFTVGDDGPRDVGGRLLAPGSPSGTGAF